MELKQKITDQISTLSKELFELDVEIELTIPDAKFGDFSTNVAMQLAGKLQKNPRELAELLAGKLSESGLRAEVAGPGFINLWAPDSELWGAVGKRDTTVFSGKRFVIEYSCPNYFKELHAGHLYQTIYGDVVARMVERSGAEVFRTNFGADVGLSAARALWGIIENIGGEFPDKLGDIPEDQRTKFIATSYVEGAKADTSEDDTASQQILEVNKKIYSMHATGDTESAFAQIYFTCRDWCREYFEKLYHELKVTKFDKFYPESTTEARGRQEVDSHIDSVFTKSQDAVVYEGEKDGLHTRVFITREGLPTYETKDLGLILIEMEEFAFDHRILITGREQTEYMKVVWQATDKILPGIRAKMTHLTNGLIRFGDGQKMSSRTGNVTTAMDVLSAVREAVGESGDAVRDEQIYLGAVKYEFLKHRLGGDIAFDPEGSVSLQGNSGPYLQYALVRAKSILAKSTLSPSDVTDLEQGERHLVRKLAEYQLVLNQSTIDYAVHPICSYLYELAQEFNKFYENNLVVGDPRETTRLSLVQAYADTLADGLSILGIQAPDKM